MIMAYKYKKKAQAWSTDLMLAMVAFGIIVVIFYSVIASNDNKEIDTLQNDAKHLSNMIKNSGDSTLNNLIQNNELQDERILYIINDMCENIDNKDDEQGAIDYYNELKSRMNLNSDFCIYFGDRNKKAVLIKATKGDCSQKCFAGIGNPNFNITNGIRCGLPTPCN